MNLDSSYDVYIVKSNKGKVVRLALLSSLMKLHMTGVDDRTEIEIISETEEEFKNELWQEKQAIWFSPLNPRIWEATRDDEQAKKEYETGLTLLETLPDIDPRAMIGSQAGTLIKLILQNDTIQVAEGQNRSLIDKLVKKHL